MDRVNRYLSKEEQDHLWSLPLDEKDSWGDDEAWAQPYGRK